MGIFDNLSKLSNLAHIQSQWNIYMYNTQIDNALRI